MAACGGSAAEPLAAGPGDDVPGDGTSATGDGAKDDAGAGDAAPADGGGDRGEIDDRIDPIEVGRAWTYNVQVLGFYPACENGVHTATTLEESQLDGKRALHVQSLCKNAGVFKYAVDGDRVHYHHLGAWRLSLESPVEEGYEWTDDFLTYTWEKKGRVTTPAGSFDDCWSAKTVASYTSYILLCRGVGPVKWHYEDGFGNGYEAVLTSKNF